LILIKLSTITASASSTRDESIKRTSAPKLKNTRGFRRAAIHRLKLIRVVLANAVAAL
jgi:hypothetical protein